MGFFDIFKKKKNDEQREEDEKGFLNRLKEGLSKTSSKLVGGIEAIILGRKKIDDDLLEELEELFITADIGVNTTIKIIEKVKNDVSRNILKDPVELKNAIKDELIKILSIDNSLKKVDTSPFVILVVGVNGTGKTTTIAKLARMFKNNGFSVLLAAGDTFRAAAIDQLQVWGDRIGVPVVKQSEGSDSAAVIYDAVESAKARGNDIVIADTAGRLHNKFNLMNELKKIVKVLGKSVVDAPHEVLLVIDATSGQNAIEQAKRFKEDVGVTGIVLTKLDGTAKGGVIVGIVDETGIPVKFIGFGEKMDDLKPFDAKLFVDALFEQQR
ncbi:signal recognition particle-docking protein FtsY [Calditerrivibrio nitroreducens]|uniref:Signal recognition particle receptor FtsY n=1 Tax=Calditerrivibrio nitroreducens (strain DSM 19672 / NBRC 101217 / Yu37-1) TaxID=768670 RepID=E4TI81_CALNY|nr:signal recognition particle-docking protein FtsY [Calditerrivibrio nitroreducens]ADR18997.1 signal recognition particle-docking protein FtsY [Calditerrivibrio nitroreducens DSM 19672]